MVSRHVAERLFDARVGEGEIIREMALGRRALEFGVVRTPYEEFSVLT